MAGTTTVTAEASPSKTSGSSSGRVTIALVAALIVLTLAVYGRTAGFDYVHWDDQIHIYANPYVETLTADHMRHIWTKPYEGLYIPASYTVYALIAHYARMPQFDTSITSVPTSIDPHPFHVANLILHLLNVLLVFALIRRLLRTQTGGTRGVWGDSLPAFAGTLLFALHPFQAESVAWISELRGLLCSVFCLSGVYCYLCAVADPRSKDALIPAARWTYWAAFLLCILAGLAKPSIAALPVALFAIDRWAAGRSIRACVASVVPWLLLAAVLVYKTHDAQPVQARIQVPLWTHPFVAGDALAFYLTKLVIPWGMTIDYGRKPQVIVGNSWGYLTWLVPAAVAYIIYRYRKSMPLAVTACFISLSMLLPVLGLVAFAFQDYSTVADRYMYLAMIGPALVLAAVLARLAGAETAPNRATASRSGSTNRRKRAHSDAPPVASTSAASAPRPILIRVYAVTGVVLAVYAALTFVQVGRWKDSVALFSYAERKNPDGYQMREDFGVALKEDGKIDEAMEQLNEAIAIQPGDPMLYNEVGLIQYQKGLYDDAIKNFQLCIQHDPTFAEAHRDLAQALLDDGHVAQAVDEFQQSVNLAPLNTTCLNDYAGALLQVNRFADAIAEYRAALNIDPAMPEALYGLAIALTGSGDPAAGEAQARQAVALVPNVARAHGALARALDAEGHTSEAIDEYKKATELDPKDPMMHYNLAVIYFNHGDRNDAIPELQQAATLQPSPAYYDALGSAYELNGDKADARAAFQEELQLDPNSAQAQQQLARLGP